MTQNKRPRATPTKDNLSGGVIASDERAHERRLHLRAFGFWFKLKEDRPWPSLREFRGEAIKEFRAQSFLLDVHDPDNPTILYAGEGFKERFGGRPAKGTALKAAPKGSFLKLVCDDYIEALETKSPIDFEGVVREPNNVHVSYRGCFMPMSDQDDNIEYLYAVVSWHQASEGNTPIGLKSGSSSALATMLEECQTHARNLGQVTGRSRDTLYGVLANCLRFFEASEAAPEEYAEILSGAKLKTQARAPFTPILKLIFGMDYDKTRITEYAAALGHARRMGATPETLVEFLNQVSGGIKGCVKKERRAKRGRSGRKSKPAITFEQAQVKLSASRARALDRVQLDDDFCLMIARRSVDGSPEILDVADVPKAALKAALIKAASKK